MLADQRNYLRAHIVAIECVQIQPIQKTFRWSNTRFFMSARAPTAFEKFGCRRLTEIVAQGSEHYGDLLGVRKVVDQLTCAIDDEASVNKDIALRMPFRILRYLNQCFDFGK